MTITRRGGMRPMAQVRRARILAFALAFAALGGGTALGASPGTSPSGPSSAPDAAPFTAATVAAPGSDPLGVSYGDWATRWWTWLLGFPADTNPAAVDACDEGQGSDVVFVPQTFLGMELATTCHVTAGTPILVSPAGSVSIADPGDTDADIVAEVTDALATLTNANVNIDGQQLTGLESFAVMGDPFDLPLVEGNLFGADPGTARAVAGGIFVMLSDLEPGTHTIVVHDESEDPTEGLLVAEVTATIEVADAASSPAPSE